MKQAVRIVVMLLGLATLAAVLTASAAPTAALRIDASLDRKAMTTDDAAVLTLTVNGNQRVEVELPHIEGLRFQPRGSTTRMEMINGKVTTSLMRTVLVYANEPGDYTIPKIKAKAGSAEALSDSELTLKVSQGTGRSGPVTPQFSPGGNRIGSAKVTAGKPGDLAFLEIVPGKTDVVVGELVPMEIRAYFRAGERISLRSHPKVQGGAFTLRNQEGEPRQERVNVGGVPYTRLIFHAGIAGAKPGEFPVEVALDATVVVREKGSGRNPMKDLRSRMGSIFDDPFFGDDRFDDFFGRLVEKEVDLVSDPIEMTVAELPAEGRPDGFRGAVGRFTARAVVKEAAVRAGDPVTLKVAVEGEGNFDRVTMPKLSASKGWKVYPASSEFVAGDAIGRSGVKRFEQVIVPLSPDLTEVPPLELAFYDPESGAYEVARTEPVAIEVTGEAVAEVQAAPELEKEVLPGESGDSAIDQSDTGAMTPLYARPWFLASQLLAIVVILSGLAVLVFRNRRAGSTRRIRKEFDRRIRLACSEMEWAIGRNDAGAFFESLRRLIQWHASGAFGLKPAALTASEVNDPAIRKILELADAVSFSGQPVSVSELPPLKETVMQWINPKP